jgi:hypothetical protein
VKQGISSGAVLIAISIVLAGAPAVAAPNELGGSASSQQKREKAQRPNLEQIIRHKMMGVISLVEDGIAEAGAQQAKMKAAMAAKAAMAKQKAAMAAKAKQEAAMAARVKSAAEISPDNQTTN